MATQLIATINDSRFERINGQLVERPVPNTLHAQVQKRILYLLDELLQNTDAEIYGEWSIARPGHTGEDDPDYMTIDVLVCFPPFTEAKNRHLAVPGFLAVEIVSPGQGQDLIEKAICYANWGTPHVWIINPDTRVCLEFYSGTTVTIAQYELTAGELIKVPVSSIFSKLSKTPGSLTNWG